MSLSVEYLLFSFASAFLPIVAAAAAAATVVRLDLYSLFASALPVAAAAVVVVVVVHCDSFFRMVGNVQIYATYCTKTRA